MTEKKINKLEILKHIKLGTSEVLYYPYNNGREPLPLRPISSFELDQCLYNALGNAPEKIAELVIKLRLKFIEPTREINVSDEGYVNLQRFYHAVDYWAVYFAMKDFQDEDFSKPDPDSNYLVPRGFNYILKMSEIHEIANFVLDASIQPADVVKEIVQDDYGKEVAYAVYYLKQPLAKVKDLTKLQKVYLIYSKGELQRVDKTKDYIISGETMTIEELLKRFR